MIALSRSVRRSGGSVSFSARLRRGSRRFSPGAIFVKFVFFVIVLSFEENIVFEGSIGWWYCIKLRNHRGIAPDISQMSGNFLLYVVLADKVPAKIFVFD